MTSDSDEEISACLALLVKSSAGTGLMHESFNVENVNIYTRSWFAWANGLFGELILQLVADKPHLVLKGDSSDWAAAQQYVNAPVSLKAQKNTIVN
jgi:meiotically up-regulated gene 157 (Mug157) protein